MRKVWMIVCLVILALSVFSWLLGTLLPFIYFPIGGRYDLVFFPGSIGVGSLTPKALWHLYLWIPMAVAGLPLLILFYTRKKRMPQTGFPVALQTKEAEDA
jgi:hypothetical protein